MPICKDRPFNYLVFCVYGCGEIFFDVNWIDMADILLSSWQAIPFAWLLFSSIIIDYPAIVLFEDCQEFTPVFFNKDVFSGSCIKLF